MFKLVTPRMLALILPAVLLFAACGGDDDDDGAADDGGVAGNSVAAETGGGATEQPAGGEGGEVIRIGMATSLSGAVSALGVDCADGVQQAVNMLNESGGVLGRNLELEVRDDQSLPEVGVEEARRLVSSGVDLLVAPASSSIALAVTGISEDAKLPMVSCTSATAELTIQQFQPYYFSFTPNTYMTGKAEAIAFNELGYDSFNAIAADYEGGHAAIGSFRDNIKTVNPDATFSDGVFFPLGETDFTPYINSLMADDAPVINSALFGGDLIAFTRQAKAAGFFDEKVFGSLYDTQALEDLGEDAPEGAIAFDRAPWQAFEGEYAEPFLEGFRATYDRYPSMSAAMGFDSVIAWAQAVEAAGTTAGDAVVEAFESGTEFQTLRGPVTVRPVDHQATVVGEYYARIGPYDEDLGFARLEEIKAVPGEDVMPSPEEVERMRAES